MNGEQSALECKLVQLWQEALNTDHINADDNFHDLGGDSLMAVMLLTRITEELGHLVPLEVFYQNPTLSHLCDYIGGRSKWSDALAGNNRLRNHARPLLAARIRPTGSKPPLFFVSPLGGLFPSTILVGVLDLALALDAERPVYGLQPPAIAPDYFALRVNVEDWHADGTRLESIIQQFISMVSASVSNGAYDLAGYCSGAFLALELAHALKQQGHPPNQLVLLDPVIPTEISANTNRTAWDQHMAWFIAKDLANNRLGLEVSELRQQLLTRPSTKRWQFALDLLREKSLAPERISATELEELYRVRWVNERIILKLIADRPPPHYGGAISILLSQGEPAPDPSSVERTFGPPVAGHFSLRLLSSDHASVFQKPLIGESAAVLDAVLDNVPIRASF